MFKLCPKGIFDALVMQVKKYISMAVGKLSFSLFIYILNFLLLYFYVHTSFSMIQGPNQVLNMYCMQVFHVGEFVECLVCCLCLVVQN